MDIDDSLWNEWILPLICWGVLKDHLTSLESSDDPGDWKMTQMGQTRWTYQFGDDNLVVKSMENYDNSLGWNKGYILEYPLVHIDITNWKITIFNG